MEAWIIVAAIVVGAVALAPRYPGYSVLVAGLGCTLGAAVVAIQGYPPQAMLLAWCLPGLLLVVLVCRGSAEREKAGHVWAKWLILACGEVLVLSPLVGGAITMAVFGGLVYNTLVFRAFLRDRLATHTTVLSTLAACVRQNLPLVPALRAATAGRTDTTGKTLRRIADHIEKGYPLGLALRVGFGACPGSVVGAVRAAERSGQTRDALAAMEADLFDTARSKMEEGLPTFGYALLLMGMAWLVLSFVGWFVMPRMVKIYLDFGIALPMALRMVYGLVTGGGWLVPLASAVVLLVVLPVSIYVALRPRRPNTWQLMARLGDWFRWNTPIARWFARTRSVERTAGALHLALAAGEPVDVAIETTLLLDVNARYRRRLERWLSLVREGRPVDEAARTAKVGSTLAWALDDEINPANAPAVLEMLTAFYHDAYLHWLHVATAVVVPLQLLVAAAVTGWIVYALYSPLFTIIGSMVDTVMP